MALRLELKQTAGPGMERGKRRWSFERGRRTIGRSGDCDWQLEDPKRTISKLHCMIVADRDGFLLRDESANGSNVDGRIVQEGETARLAQGSRLQFGEFAFEVSISGAKEPEFGDPEGDIPLGDENLTISSILADVAPAADRSHGLRGSSDAWRDLPAGNVDAPSSRRVEIGWSGPPQPDAMAPILPDNWYEDSEYGNRLEHGPATHISVPHVRKTPAEGENAGPDEAALPAEPFDVPEPEPPVEQQVFVAPAAPAPGADTLAHLEALAARCEEACADIFASLDIDMEAVLPPRDMHGVPHRDALRERLQTVLDAQFALKSALGGLIAESTRMLEPRIVEARVDAERGTLPNLPLLRDRSYWQAYKAQFERDGGTLSVRDLLRDAMLRSLGTDTAHEDGG